MADTHTKSSEMADQKIGSSDLAIALAAEALDLTTMVGKLFKPGT